MTAVSDTVVAGAPALTEFSRRVAEAMGAAPAVAAEVARHLVSANLSGHDSHGVLRWAQYAEEVDTGQLDPAAQSEFLREGPVLALLDARRGVAQHSSVPECS